MLLPSPTWGGFSQLGISKKGHFLEAYEIHVEQDDCTNDTCELVHQLECCV